MYPPLLRRLFGLGGKGPYLRADVMPDEVWKQVACVAANWKLAADVANGEYLVLPDGLKYQPGKSTILLTWEGVTCTAGENFTETEANGTQTLTNLRGENVEVATSDRLTLLFTAKAGSEFTVSLVSPCYYLGDTTDTSNLVSKVNTLQGRVSAIVDHAVFGTQE